MLILAGGVFFVLKSLVRRDSYASKWAVLAVHIVCLLNPLLFLWEASRIRDSGDSFPYLVIPLAGAAVRSWKWPRFPVYALYVLLVILCPFAVSNMAQTLWKAAFPDNQNCTSGERPGLEERAEMNAEPVELQRLVWITFDELDQRILFEKRPAGYEFPGFDS